MKSRYIIPVVLMISASLTTADFNLCAQMERTLKFNPEEVDFGTIREEDGKITQNVKAINISNAPTFIISARTSCGCSSLTYTERELVPGDTAIISVTYDPLNRPGKFLKTAKIFTGNERIGNSFKLKGTVIPSKKNLDRAYPETSGVLRLSSKMIDAGEISKSEARPLFVGLYNDSNSPLALAATTDADALEATLMPDTIEPFGIATLTLMLKGRNIPANETEIIYKAHLLNTATSDTLISIPVGANLK